ncbi:hypothetical protein BKA82DRAFT_26720 [Pisolithus tinctorius]|uniref:Uncharacterized protein n=1 Tax=Pisolithus tinctorius Marx 270 TaxID=870435 RepID=A0A0C3NC61_PISTI|nr:hypothetical protein BKA82DRAFT_26720 [Pisolithus tinctorius]KIN93158.1 hypothetical protein M404DRAFT_36340 [Pisolithus tinctorius Marx 270]KIO03748.1 hypothetical protein M404DRAFT_26720 [Pisolithus tinctorius Marx 270]
MSTSCNANNTAKAVDHSAHPSNVDEEEKLMIQKAMEEIHEAFETKEKAEAKHQEREKAEAEQLEREKAEAKYREREVQAGVTKG